MGYARGTKVTTTRSIAEINRAIKNLCTGETHFHYVEGIDSLRATITKGGVRIKITVPLPPKPEGKRFDPHHERVRMERYRALALVVKTHLVCEEEKIEAIGERV